MSTVTLKFTREELEALVDNEEDYLLKLPDWKVGDPLPSGPAANSASDKIRDAYATRPTKQESYAASEIRRLLAQGPAPFEDFYRLKVTGDGETKWVNVSPEQLEAIAAIL